MHSGDDTITPGHPMHPSFADIEATTTGNDEDGHGPQSEGEESNDQHGQDPNDDGSGREDDGSQYAPEGPGVPIGDLFDEDLGESPFIPEAGGPTFDKSCESRPQVSGTTLTCHQI